MGQYPAAIGLTIDGDDRNPRAIGQFDARVHRLGVGRIDDQQVDAVVDKAAQRHQLLGIVVAGVGLAQFDPVHGRLGTRTLQQAGEEGIL